MAVGKAETELKQLKTKISHSEKELKEKTKQLLSKQEEAVAVEKELSLRTKDVENVKKALESLSFEEGKMEALQKVHSSIGIDQLSPKIVNASNLIFFFSKLLYFRIALLSLRWFKN